MVSLHRLNTFLALTVGVVALLTLMGGWEAGELDALTGAAFGAAALWGLSMAATRWVHLGSALLTAPLHGRFRWADVEDVHVGEVTGTVYFPRTAVILTVASSVGTRKVALTEVSRKVGNPRTDALALECGRRAASARGDESDSKWDASE